MNKSYIWYNILVCVCVLILQAKLSYLTQKCKDKDAVLQAAAMEIRKTDPEKAEHLINQLSTLHSSPLPRDASNQPLSTQPRVRGRLSRSNRSRVLDPVTEEDAIGAGDGRTSKGQRSRRHQVSTLDDLDLGGDTSLDFGEISVNELIDQTSRTTGGGRRRPLRYEDGDEEDDLVASVVGDSMSRIRHGLRERESYGDDVDDGIGGGGGSRSAYSRRSPRRQRHRVPVRYMSKN